jgi:hypothetical protein
VDFFAKIGKEEGVGVEELEKQFIATHRPTSLTKRLATVYVRSPQASATTRRRARRCRRGRSWSMRLALRALPRPTISSTKPRQAARSYRCDVARGRRPDAREVEALVEAV